MSKFDSFEIGNRVIRQHGACKNPLCPSRSIGCVIERCGVITLVDLYKYTVCVYEPNGEISSAYILACDWCLRHDNDQ